MAAASGCMDTGRHNGGTPLRRQGPPRGRALRARACLRHNPPMRRSIHRNTMKQKPWRSWREAWAPGR